MLCAQNAAPRQQWTPPMTITPQVAPMANQAFETSQFIFFLKHPTVVGSEVVTENQTKILKVVGP